MKEVSTLIEIKTRFSFSRSTEAFHHSLLRNCNVKSCAGRPLFYRGLGVTEHRRFLIF